MPQCAVAVVFLVYCWLAQHPPGLGSVDEKNYTVLARQVLRGLHRGPASFFEATRGPNAPLIPALASWLTSSRFVSTAVVLVQIPFLCLLLVAVYFACSSLAGRRMAVIGCWATLGVPGVLCWARQLHFALAATALLMAAVAMAFCSRALSSRSRSIATGVLLGLAALSRTMTLGLIPGVVLGLVVMAVVAQTPVRRWAPNLALSIVAGTLVAAAWYIPNWHAVAHYLLGNTTTGPFAERRSTLDFSFWTGRVGELWSYLLLPLGLLATAVVLLAALAAHRRRPARRAVPAEVWLLVCATVCGLAVLTATRNLGTGFALPLVPWCLVLVVWLGRLLRPRTGRIIAGLCLVMSATNLIAGLVPVGRLEVFGLAVVDGRGANDVQIAQAFDTPDARLADPRALGLQMWEASCAVPRVADGHPVLLTTANALISPQSIRACPDSPRGARLLYSGCPDGIKGAAATDCLVRSLDDFHWRTVLVSDVLDDYPGSIARPDVLPALEGSYHVTGRYPIGRFTVELWTRNAPAEQTQRPPHRLQREPR